MWALRFLVSAIKAVTYHSFGPLWCCCCVLLYLAAWLASCEAIAVASRLCDFRWCDASDCELDTCALWLAMNREWLCEWCEWTALGVLKLDSEMRLRLLSAPVRSRFRFVLVFHSSWQCCALSEWVCCFMSWGRVCSNWLGHEPDLLITDACNILLKCRLQNTQHIPNVDMVQLRRPFWHCGRRGTRCTQRTVFKHRIVHGKCSGIGLGLTQFYVFQPLI